MSPNFPHIKNILTVTGTLDQYADGDHFGEDKNLLEFVNNHCQELSFHDAVPATDDDDKVALWGCGADAVDATLT